MSVAVDDATFDTVGYYDISTKLDSCEKTIVSFRFEIIDSIIVKTWQSKPVVVWEWDYTSTRAKALRHLKEVARLCNF